MFNKIKLMNVQHIRLIKCIICFKKFISPVQVIRELWLLKTPMNTHIITHRQSHVWVKIIFNPGMRQKGGLQYLIVTSTSKMSLIQRYWTGPVRSFDSLTMALKLHLLNFDLLFYNLFSNLCVDQW